MNILSERSVKGTLIGWIAVSLLTMTGCTHWLAEGQQHESAFNTRSLSGGEVRHFLDSVRFSKDDAGYLYRLGRHFQQRGKHRLAVREFLRVIEIDPLRADVHNALGVSFDKLLEFDLAEQHYRWALVLNPDFAAVYNNLGFSYLIQGKPQQAIDPLQKAVALQGQNVLFHNNLGLAYKQTGQAYRAMAEWHDTGSVRQAHALGGRNQQLIPFQSEIVQTRPGSDQSREDAHNIKRYSKLENKEKPAISSDGQAPVWVAPQIEIANGNGIPNMARNIGRLFQGNGYLVHRRSNADHFHYKRTRIIFGEDQRQVAGSLAQILFGPEVTCDLIDNDGNDGEVTVLIGRDIVPLNQLLSGRLKVEVANGNGVQGMAQRLTGALKAKGFHTVPPVNADHFDYERTQIRYPLHELGNAQFIAREMAGICSGRLVRDDRIGTAIRIIVGRDFKI